MKTTLWAALGAVLLAFPATAAQDHSPWWDCVATYLSQQRDILTAHPEGPLALSAVVSCRDLSMREGLGEDIDAVKAVLAHFRRLAAMPGAPPAFQWIEPAKPAPKGDMRF
jgi:hypothetical protein